MRAPIRSTGRAIRRHLTRQCIGWLALFVAISGTSFAATSIVYPTSVSSATSDPLHVSWVKINDEGTIADQSGNTFTVRRVTNGMYTVSFSGYASGRCATTVQAHDIRTANRILTEVDESSSSVEVRAYLAYTELNYDTDLTVLFACE